MNGIVPPNRHEVMKNGTRIGDQGQQLPIRAKFQGNLKEVGATFFHFV